jgi:hypothetical protein
MSTPPLKKTNAAVALADQALADLHARIEATRAALDRANAEKTTLAERHAKFILGKADALPAGVLVAASANVDRLNQDLLILEGNISSGEEQLVMAEIAAASALREEWSMVKVATDAQLVEVLASLGWLGWRASVCAGQDRLTFKGYVQRQVELSIGKMFPTNFSTLDGPPPECPNLPLPVRNARSQRIPSERRYALECRLGA